LILSGIGIPKRFFGSAPTEKIERDGPARRKIGHEPIIEMKIVWKPVHQNDARVVARVLSGINAMLIPPDRVLYEVHGQFPKPLCFDVRKSERLCSTPPGQQSFGLPR